MIRLVFCFLTIVLPLTSTYAQNYWERLSYPECEEMTGVYINTKGKSFDVSLRCVKTIANPEHC